MYILTRAEPLENCEDNIYRFHNTKVEKQYLDVGYQIYERSYQLKSQHKDYIVVCPELRKRKGGAEPVVLIPDFLVPGRPYPVYIYVYAIGLYTSMPEKGQRWAAEETRIQFGLESFAHTTLGRALKSFVRYTREDTADRPEDTADRPEDTADRPEDTAAAVSGAFKKAVFPSTRSTEALRRQAALLLSGMPPYDEKPQFVIASLCLTRELFTEYQRFLL